LVVYNGEPLRVSGYDLTETNMPDAYLADEQGQRIGNLPLYPLRTSDYQLQLNLQGLDFRLLPPRAKLVFQWQNGSGGTPSRSELALVLPALPTPTFTPEPVAQLTIGAQTINVRQGPGTNYDVIGLAEAGATFVVLGSNGDGTWWQIEYGNGVGWVFGDLAQRNEIAVAVVGDIPLPPTSTFTPVPADTATNTPLPPPELPTNTPVPAAPPTNTPEPPTATPIPPPTATFTPVPPTPVIRYLLMNGNVRLRDDETFGSDERKEATVSENFTLTPPDVTKSYAASWCAGDEVRGELHLQFDLLDGGLIRATGRALYFEGTSCGTQDLEKSQDLALEIPANESRPLEVHLGDGDGDVDLVLTLQNLSPFVMSPTMTEVELLQLRYLEAEFARLDLLLRREVRKWVLAGQDPNDDYRGMYITQAEAETLLDRPFGVSWGQWIALPAEEVDSLDRLSAQVEAQIRETEQVLAKRGIRPRLLQLAANFGLDRTALDILLLCIAPAFDTKYERLYGYLQDNVTRRRPSVRLILDLLGAPGVEKLTLAAHLQEEAPLFRQVLLSFVVESPPANAHWLNQTLQPSETVVAWLRGYYQPDPKLVGHITVNRCEPEERGVAREACADAIQDYPWLPQLQHSCGADAPILVITGTDGEKQHTFAAQIAMLCDASLLTADLSKIIGEECTPLEALHLVLRDATMTGSLPFLSGWDRCLIDGQVDTAIIAMLCQHSGPVIVGCNNPWLAGG
ncbi:MAG: SH3 domain-containing protein, partial [Caldilineaceae bacterium]|nr:SH3 domain-containing protein [Caldilineaceae bacterium]